MICYQTSFSFDDLKLSIIPVFSSFNFISGNGYFCSSFMILFCFSTSNATNGALIVGLEHRMTQIETKFEDLDSSHWEESDNLSNERDLDRFIMTGAYFFLVIPLFPY